ncbi:MAG TPA: hypothetical protein VK866_07490 [Acidimicrobiales bacterium]|nr:hypothetical protein [Acidimicrobiales bacterium]
MAWTESRYLDVVSDDGLAAVITRLAHHPAEGVWWLWAHVLTPEGCAGFVDNALPDPLPADVTASFEGDERTAAVEVAVLGHAGATVPQGAGDLPLRVSARFEATGDAGGTLPGRTEVLGAVRAQVTVGDRSVEIVGRGQWHRQEQDTPRFTQAFTYGTVRGDGLGAVLVAAGGPGGALVVDHGSVTRASGARIDPPGDDRAVALSFDDGRRIDGRLRATYRYTLPLPTGPRPGSVVVGELGGVAVSGCVNDFRPATT